MLAGSGVFVVCSVCRFVCVIRFFSSVVSVVFLCLSELRLTIPDHATLRFFLRLRYL